MALAKPIANSAIVHAYLVESLSVAECSKRFGLAVGTIHRRLKAENVNLRPAHGPVRPGSPILDGAPTSTQDKAAYMRALRAKNPEKLAAYNRAYKAVNAQRDAEANRIRARKWYAENKAKAKEAAKVAYAADPDGYKRRAEESKRQRLAEDPDTYRAREASYKRHRRRTNLKVAIDDRMSNAIFYALRRKKAGRSWLTLVDYTLADLIARLQETMPAGYSWDDVLSGALHIDHIRPKASFNYESAEDPDFQRCWGLENLQLLPALENIKKGARLSVSFEPALL